MGRIAPTSVSSSPAAATGARSDAAAPSPTILLADDDPLIVATLGHGLRSAGYQVLVAYDGAHALEICLESNPALAIVDYAMPGLTGVELARQIAKRTSTAVIFLSAYSDQAIVGGAIDAGAMAYLVKPVDTEQLLTMVRTVLQRSREFRALQSQAEQLNTALQMSRNVSVATGVLMEKFGIDQQEALERLRRQARSTRTRLEEVATQLLRMTDETARLYGALGQRSQVRSRDGDTKP